MHSAVDAGFPRIEPDIYPDLHSALFDLAEKLRKFQKGRYFCFQFPNCFLAQLKKNYGEDGAEILQDNCQVTVFGGFAPNSKTAEKLSLNLGNRTVLSGQVSHSTENASEMLQMMQRPLMTADELKSMPKGSFVVMKTGSNPMRTKLRLFFEWGIRFDLPLAMEEHELRPVNYASREELMAAIQSKYPYTTIEIPAPEMTPLEVHLQEQVKQPDGLVTKTDK